MREVSIIEGKSVRALLDNVMAAPKNQGTLKLGNDLDVLSYQNVRLAQALLEIALALGVDVDHPGTT